MEALQAFIQFFVDLFSALSTFLTGESGTFDLSGLFNSLTDDEEESSAAE